MADIKIKAKVKDGIVKVKALAKHQMSTYNQAMRKTGDKNNAQFITHISATVNGKVVYEVSTSQFVSKDPIFKFKFVGALKGDKISMTYIDNKGNTKTNTAKIK